MDERLIFYFPFYAVGLLAGREKFRVKKHNPLTVAAAFLAACLLCGLMIWHQELPEYLLKPLVSYLIVWLFCTCFLVVFVQIALSLPEWINKTFSVMSYGSMCMYLFHRQFYVSIWVHTGDIPLWIAYAVLLPCLAAAGYGLQWLYDGALRRIETLPQRFLRKADE